MGTDLDLVVGGGKADAEALALLDELVLPRPDLVSAEHAVGSEVDQSAFAGVELGELGSVAVMELLGQADLVVDNCGDFGLDHVEEVGW